MWFKNLQLYRLSTPFTLSAEALAEQMAARAFSGCTRLDRSHSGWAEPYGLDELVVAAGGALWFSLKNEDKLLPSSVVNQTLTDKLAHIEATEARRVGRKEKQTLKEQIEDELLPRAFSRFSRTHAVLDPESGWLLVDAANAGKAEGVISALLQAVEGVRLERPDAAQSPASKMADLLLTPAEEQELQRFQLDSDCELKGAGDTQSVVRFARHNLSLPEVAAHLATGKQPVKLGLQWQNRVSFVLTEDWQVRRIKFLDLVQDQVTDSQADDQRALIEATLTIQIAELRGLLTDLMAWLGEATESPANT